MRPTIKVPTYQKGTRILLAIIAAPCRSGGIASNPFLASIATRLTSDTNSSGQLPGTARSSTRNARTISGVNVGVWLIDYNDLRLGHQIGEGSFGKV